MNAKHSRPKNVGPLVTIAFVAFGVFLLVGAVFAVWGREWPWFLPPQIDLLYLLFMPLGQPLNRYLAGLALAAFGLLMMGTPFLVNRKDA